MNNWQRICDFVILFISLFDDAFHIFEKERVFIRSTVLYCTVLYLVLFVIWCDVMWCDATQKSQHIFLNTARLYLYSLRYTATISLLCLPWTWRSVSPRWNFAILSPELTWWFRPTALAMIRCYWIGFFSNNSTSQTAFGVYCKLVTRRLLMLIVTVVVKVL